MRKVLGNDPSYEIAAAISTRDDKAFYSVAPRYAPLRRSYSAHFMQAPSRKPSSGFRIEELFLHPRLVIPSSSSASGGRAYEGRVAHPKTRAYEELFPPPPPHPGPSRCGARGHHSDGSGAGLARRGAALGNITHGLRGERRHRQVDRDRPDFDATETIAPVAGDAIAVIALFVAVDDRVATSRIATIRPAAIG